jgi:hypothetical protein
MKIVIDEGVFQKEVRNLQNVDIRTLFFHLHCYLYTFEYDVVNDCKGEFSFKSNDLPFWVYEDHPNFNLDYLNNFIKNI